MPVIQMVCGGACPAVRRHLACIPTCQSCKPQGMPDYLLSRGPFLLLQTPTKVVMVEEASQQGRHIYLNVPQAENPTPSWVGESVGHYEGDSWSSIPSDSRREPAGRAPPLRFRPPRLRYSFTEAN